MIGVHAYFQVETLCDTADIACSEIRRVGLMRTLSLNGKIDNAKDK